MSRYKTQKGIVLIISMIFLCVFSALAISLAALSDTNVQLADNQHKVNSALSAAQSGLEIVGLWLSEVAIPGDTTEAQRFNLIAECFESAAYDISNINTNHDSSSITIPSVMLDSTSGQNFYAEMGPLPSLDDPNILQADVTGVHGPITRTIRVNYTFGTRKHTVFDYGVATKGPLHLAGNTELEGVTIAGESDIYIESDVTDETLSVTGNSQIAGDVSFASSDPHIVLGANASIGGESGQDAIDNHVFTGVAPVEFPTPNPGYFEQYIQNLIDTNETVFENIRIPGGTNPSFSGGVELRGIIFIETPNIVIFTGNTTIIGIIVGDGDLNDNSGTNQIIFEGNVDSHPVTDLPEEFGELRNETGTFLMAPGFKTSFGGSFETLNGAIAANGIEFYGNAGGIIEGSVINYSDEPMTLIGNSDLYFNRSGTSEIPAGFVPEIVLHYDPTSYSEGPF